MRILIEPAALMHVIGTTMDFVEDRIKCALYPVSPRAATGLPQPEHHATREQCFANLEKEVREPTN